MPTAEPQSRAITTQRGRLVGLARLGLILLCCGIGAVAFFIRAPEIGGNAVPVLSAGGTSPETSSDAEVAADGGEGTIRLEGPVEITGPDGTVIRGQGAAILGSDGASVALEGPAQLSTSR